MARGSHRLEYAALGRTGRVVRRHDGDDLVTAGVPIGAGASLVFHASRWLAAQAFRARASAFRTPSTATWIAGFVVGIPAGILDIGTLSDLSNIGTLFAFALVSIGVIILRYRDPGRHRGFRAPGGIAAPVLSVMFCVLLMSGLPILTWIRFFAWLVIGLSIYFLYSRHRSEFARK